MRKFPAEQFANFAKVIAIVRSVGGTSAENPSHSYRATKDACKLIAGAESACRAIGLRASAATIRKIAALGTEEQPSRMALVELAGELDGRLNDEMRETYFMVLTPRESQFYGNPREGWEDIIKRFPASLGDVEEAAKCLALSRYAATVFHSIQVVEIGLIELGRFLDVKDPLPGWTATSGRLKEIVKKPYKDRSPLENENYAFVEQTEGTVEALKNAWRNKISHAHGKLVVLTADFTPEIAEDILYASRTFMRRLTEGLPPLPPMRISDPPPPPLGLE